MRDPGSARITQRWHEEILDAIRAHDAEATRKLMQDHLLDFERRIRAYLQSQDGDGHRPRRTPPAGSAKKKIGRTTGRGRANGA
jgi:hypothetical protein